MILGRMVFTVTLFLVSLFQTLKNRPVSVDIAGGKGGDDYGGRGRRDPGEDRTTGDWRRGGGHDEQDGPQDFHDREQYGGPDRPDRRLLFILIALWHCVLVCTVFLLVQIFVQTDMFYFHTLAHAHKAHT